MKKTILATAMAAAMTGTAWADGHGMADGLYGNIRVGIQDADANDELDVTSNKLVFGWKGA